MNSQNIDNLDLNIDNYSLDDLFCLFKIPPNFNEYDLKQAKKIVLNSHPDKSKLHPDYFRFFSKAYKMIYFIWQFKNKNPNKDIENVLNYKSNNLKNAENDSFINQHLNKFNMEKYKDSKEFNKWFNDFFEKNNIKNEGDDFGYESWLRSNEDLDEDRKIQFSQLGEEIEKKKQQVKTLIKYNGIDDMYSNFNGSNLDNGVPRSYSSELFSSLPYEDLRKAHTETVIPITADDYKNIKKFKNVDEYNFYRNSQDIQPLMGEKLNEYLSNREKMDEYKSCQTSFNLAKRMETINKNIDKSLSNMRLINNK